MVKVMSAIAAGLLAAAMTLLLAAPAPASISSRDMRDQRYCEIFTVFLAPSPVARVNNTYGLNRCPPRWWDSLDTSELAAESGADLILLNGPRYWLMDKVTVTEPGPIVELAGKQLREVATIDLAKVGLTPPPPFTGVKITRGTRFVFRHDRPVFQLIDPDGRVYVMQAYSQIVDPGLTYDQLRALRRHPDRIGLPEGWRYRTRKPDENLVLRANGTATIIQDALKNTYQRLPKRYGA